MYTTVMFMISCKITTMNVDSNGVDKFATFTIKISANRLQPQSKFCSKLTVHILSTENDFHLGAACNSYGRKCHGRGVFGNDYSLPENVTLARCNDYVHRRILLGKTFILSTC